jgi:hypothetical protein
MFVCVGYFIYLILLALLLDLDLIKIYQGKKANNKIKFCQQNQIYFDF